MCSSGRHRSDEETLDLTLAAVCTRTGTIALFCDEIINDGSMLVYVTNHIIQIYMITGVRYDFGGWIILFVFVSCNFRTPGQSVCDFLERPFDGP